MIGKLWPGTRGQPPWQEMIVDTIPLITVDNNVGRDIYT